MKCTLCGSEEELDTRGNYLVCSKCAREQRECAERKKRGEVLDRDCSPLCIRCGLCCVVLSAAVEPHEVERLALWSGRLPTDIAMVEDLPFEGRGKLVLKRPCVFLLGNPGEYVNCRAYSMDRPAVCGDYLCKLAIRYKAGACTLHEALFILRASVSHSGHVGMFNWSSDKLNNRDNNDSRLAAVIAAKRALALIDKDSPEAGALRLALFEQLHPRYAFTSDAHETIFAAMLMNTKNRALDLNQFFSAEDIAKMDEHDREVSLRAVYQVMQDITEFFTDEEKRSKS